jgi:small subunit ribosomal protein S9
VPKPLIQSTGRRKAAVARIRLRPGGGAITVNRRPLDEYFPSATHRMIITEPLRLVDKEEAYDVDTTMTGGGVSGQAGALRLALARAIADVEPDLRAPLKRAGFLTRDAREKESKKYGLKKARKAPQYSKR